MSLLRTSVRGAGFSLLSFAWPIAIALTTTPFVLRRAGAFSYGVWTLAATIFGFAGLLDFGTGNACTRELAACSQRPDGADEARTVFETALAFYCVMGCTVGGAVFASASFLQRRFAPAATPEDAANAVACFRAMGVAFPVVILHGLVVAALTAYRSFGLASGLNMAKSTSTALATAGVLALGGTMGTAILAMAGFTAASALAGVVVLGSSCIPGLGRRPRFSPPHFRRLFGFGSFLLGGQLAAMVRTSSDRLMLSSWSGPGAVSLYAIPMTIASRVHGATAAALTVVFPLMSSLRASGDGEKEDRFYRAAATFAVVFAGSLSAPLIVLARPFLRLWIGAEFSAQAHLLLAAITVAYFQLALNVVPYHALNGLGASRVTMAFHVGAAAVTIAAGCVLIPRFGALGAAATVVLANVVDTPFEGLAYERRARRSGTWWRAPLRGAVALALAVVPARLVADRLSPGWGGLVVCGALAGLFALVVFVLVVPTREDRTLAVEILRGALARRQQARAGAHPAGDG